MKKLLGVCLVLVLILLVSACEPTTTYTPPPIYTPSVPKTYQPPTPAVFSVTGLTVYPTQIQIGKATSITIRITNTGGTDGEYPLVLEIDGVKQAETTMKISGGKTSSVSYSATFNEVGDHIITVGKASVTLNVATYSTQQTPTTTTVPRTTTPPASTYQPPTYQPPTIPSYTPPTKFSNREFYLSQAENYQQWADDALYWANLALSEANRYLKMSTEQFTSTLLRDYYRQEYQKNLEDNLWHMKQFADYQKQAMEYMLKAQREP